MEREKSIGKILCFVLMGLLTVVGLLVEVAMSIKYYTGIGLATNIIMSAAMYLFLAVYAIKNYKVPHGNMLGYLFLGFAFCCLFSFVSFLTSTVVGDLSADFLSLMLRGLTILIPAYMAGKLNRRKMNVVLSIVVGILLLVLSLINCLDHKTASVFVKIWLFGYFILWIDLSIAYFVRYREHKEAGLADK